MVGTIVFGVGSGSISFHRYHCHCRSALDQMGFTTMSTGKHEQVSRNNCLFVCLFVWLVGWLVVCLFGCLFVCLFVCLLV